jgi:hypothetical protein
MNVQNTLNSTYIEDYSVEELVGGQNPAISHIVENLFDLCSPKFAYGVFALGFGAYLAFDFLRYMHSK